MADSGSDLEVRVVEWDVLRRRHPEEAADLLREKLSSFAYYATTAEQLASSTRSPVAGARALLEELVEMGELQREEMRSCANCGVDLEGMIGRAGCPECGTSFADKPPAVTERYVHKGESPRQIPWFLVVHGMNTRGEWQETLTWLVGRTYRHMVPVATYKYGKIQPGVLFHFRRRQLLQRLAVKMKALEREAVVAQLEGGPDVIAHSFGTWLVAHVLLRDESLKVGRLILLGSILPPDFPWTRLVERGQVEAILNHGATNDRWVPLAQWVIPGSGPGGTRGFPAPVHNIPATGLGHSDYFLQRHLRPLFTNVWQPFLAWRVPRFRTKPVVPKRWSAVWRPLRAVTWSMAVAVVSFVVAGSVAVVLLGWRALWRLL